MPTQQFSRSWMSESAEADPAFGGTVWSIELKMPIIARRARGRLGEVEAAGLAVGVVAQVDLDRRARRGRSRAPP